MGWIFSLGLIIGLNLSTTLMSVGVIENNWLKYIGFVFTVIFNIVILTLLERS